MFSRRGGAGHGSSVVSDDDITAEATSRVTWEIGPVGDSCRLTVTHDQLAEDADPHLYGGWPMILSGLKTWLETGQELTTPGSLMALGDGTHKLAIPADVRARTGKQAGDAVTVYLEERVAPTPR